MDKHTRLLLSPLIYIGVFMLVVYLGVNLTTSKVTYSLECNPGQNCADGQYVGTDDDGNRWCWSAANNGVKLCCTFDNNGNAVCDDVPFTPGCYYYNHMYQWWQVPPGSAWTRNDAITNKNACTGCENGYHLTGDDEEQYCAPNFGTDDSGTSTSTCSNNYLKTESLCRQFANFYCQTAGYSGCTTKDSSGCYTYSCNSSNASVCTNDALKTVSACNQTANNECGDAGYSGCTSKDSNNCYTYSCNSSSSSTVSCYQCNVNGSQLSIKATSEIDAINRTQGNNCTKVDISKCYSDNTVVNPTTGSTAIIFVWIIGVMAIGYALWYYRKVSSMNA